MLFCEDGLTQSEVGGFPTREWTYRARAGLESGVKVTSDDQTRRTNPVKLWSFWTISASLN